jgi:hypothetical protein
MTNESSPPMAVGSNAGLGVVAGPPVDGGNEAAPLHTPAARPAATPPKPRPGLAIPVVLDDGWLAQVVIPRDMSRAEMLRLRRVLWTLAVPWR